MITVYTDGGCPGNPGPMFGAGIILQDNIIIHQFVEGYYKGTNNIAEYRAMQSALSWLVANDFRGRVDCFSDSKLLVNQLNGQWSVTNEKLLKACQDIALKRAKITQVKFFHVSRQDPWIQECDRAVKQITAAVKECNLCDEYGLIKTKTPNVSFSADLEELIIQGCPQCFGEINTYVQHEP